MRRCLLGLVAACAPAPRPVLLQGSATTTATASNAERQLPDEACLRLGAERHPDEGPRKDPCTWCFADLTELGGNDLVLSGCYRKEGAGYTLVRATLDRAEAEVVFEFDGKECWIVGQGTWAAIGQPVKDFVTKTASCSRVREDYEF